LLVVDVDPEMLELVLVNLLENALRFAPPGSDITVAARPLGHGCEIRVIDHGPGVEPVEREHVFEEFVRLDGPGSGLGVSLPGADGLYALHRLRSFTSVPIVVLTVRDSKTDKVAALDGGADDYVVKPFDLDELLARIRAALRRRPDSDSTPARLVIGDLEI